MNGLFVTLFLALRNLLRNKRRSLAVLTTMAVGASSLFLFDGFNTGIMNQYRENTIHARYGHGQINASGYHEQVFEKPWEHWMEDTGPLIQELLAFPEVRDVFPRIEFYGLLTNGSVSLSGRGQGIVGAAEADFFHSLNIIEGSPLREQPDGIVLGQGLARALNVQVGDTLTILVNTIYGSINGVDAEVTGIFHTGAKEFDDVVFRIPLDVAQLLLDTQKVETIALGLTSVADWDSFAKKFTQKYPNYDLIPFSTLDKVYYQHAVDWLGAQFAVIRLIILLIVVLGIFNTVSTSILERKQEVANLRANGESKWQVMSLFLSEGFLLGFAGALLGILLAIGANVTVLANGILMPPSPGITRQFHVLIELQEMGALAAMGLCLFSALIGTLMAAWQVVRMPIGVGLRSL